MESARLTRGRLIAAGALIVALVLIIAAATLTRGDGVATSAGPRPVAPASDNSVRAPVGSRVRVEVLNASKTRGLARRATFHLRDHGFDVVSIGTAAEQRDSTLVIDRSNHPEWARLVAAALGGAAVKAQPDSSRYLDVTVLLGGTWRPPAKPFYP